MEKRITGEILTNRIEEAELFTKRFGSFSKADYEVLMFTIYLDSLCGEVRDYDISIDLGITESKVRNLRVKSQLMYPREIDLVVELSNALKGGRYDKETGTITTHIENPSVMNYLKSQIEKNYGVVGRTLNSKQMVLAVEDYLLLAALAEENKEETLDELNRLYKLEAAEKEKVEKIAFQKRFLKSIPNMMQFLIAAKDIYTQGLPIIMELIEKVTL